MGKPFKIAQVLFFLNFIFRLISTMTAKRPIKITTSRPIIGHDARKSIIPPFVHYRRSEEVSSTFVMHCAFFG